jgi:hypothetical protein
MKYKYVNLKTTMAAVLGVSILGTAASHAATTIVYDFQSLNANTSGTIALNGQDNWVAGTSLQVVLDADNTRKYAVGYDNAVNIVNGSRANNGGFAMTVPAATTQFSLSAEIRYGTFNSGGQNHRRSLFGLTVGAGNFLFGAGGDDTQDNKWLIQSGNGTQNFSSAATSAASNNFGTIKLNVDLSANSGNGSASLFLDDVAISDLQNINLNLLSLAGYTNGSSFNGMAISSGDFGRLDNLTLSYIPEPSTAFLSAIGILALMRRRR